MFTFAHLNKLYRNTMRNILAALLLLCTLGAGAQTTEQINKDFKARYKATPCALPAQALQQAKSEEARQALKFLYTYMYWPDVVDYEPSFFVRQTEAALRARREMPWGQRVPQREWQHFVLPVRVNNEALDSFRTTCYEALKARVAGLSMYDAILAVNHWCHEYVTYKPSDGRTSSPLASMRTATGRCGEESTFTVATLRAVGIPARQVYTPRWAHTDDNHAWVEAWADGRWYFLGACEPAARLNVAWFNRPASRGILMNTTVLGKYDGPEEVLERHPNRTTINVTENYAPTATTNVTIVDEQGRPVKGASVQFRLYNYAEFYVLKSMQTAADGKASLLSGLGDLIVWATYKGRYGFAKVHAGEKATIKLDRKPGDRYEVDLNIVPPAGTDTLPTVSVAAQRLCNERLAREDSIRMAYVHTFPDSAASAEFCRTNHYDFKRLRPLIEKSKGNWQVLFGLLRTPNIDRELTLRVLETLTEKDLRDFDSSVILAHIQALAGTKDYDPMIIRPRVWNEQLSPWRAYLRKAFTPKQQADFRRQPALLVDYIRKNIREDKTDYPQRSTQRPETAFAYRLANDFNRGLLFVAAARSLGIPARLDEVTMKFQYFDHDWRDTPFCRTEQQTNKPQSRLSIDYVPQQFRENPGYYSQFTISKLEDGAPVLMNYDEEATWKNDFEKGTRIDNGDYLLVSGTRLASGSVLARLSAFSLTHDTAVVLSLREDPEEVSVIGNFNAENHYYDTQEKAEKGLIATTGRGYYVLGLLKANNEPSTHILHDIEAQREALEAWGRELIMLFPTQEEYDIFMKRRGEFPNLPRNLRFGVDTQGECRTDIFNSQLTKTQELPVIIIADTFNRVVFFSQGYTIGIGDQLKRVIGKI